MADRHLGDGLLFEDVLPVSFTPERIPDEHALARINTDNIQLLAAAASLDEVRVHDTLKDESPALLHELQRLDYKLNILLKIAAELAMRQKGLPAACPVKLSALGLEWSGEQAPTMDSKGLVKLYISPALPQPLIAAATVIAEQLQDGRRVASLQFTGLNEVVVDLIEKLIFRHHRRTIAGSRATPPRNA